MTIYAWLKVDVITQYSDPDMKFKLHLSYPSTNLHLHSPALTGAAGSQLLPRSCGLRKREERKGLIQNKVWGYAVLDLYERVYENASNNCSDPTIMRMACVFGCKVSALTVIGHVELAQRFKEPQSPEYNSDGNPRRPSTLHL